MKRGELEKYQMVQRIAKDTVDHLSSYITEGANEVDIANAAKKFMLARSVSSFWYHGVEAFVLVGERTLLSISGREYKPSNKEVGQNDLVTVDVGPEIDSYWGDFARTLVIADGRVITNVEPNSTEKVKEFFDGTNVERKLHELLQNNVNPRMTFEELYFTMNKMIENLGYTNLDFKRNLGHSIEKDINKRIYIEKGCREKISDVKLFAFEPHIKRKDGLFGYKMEDIYYFSNGELRKL